jgi:SAM-dependent methyltransferase
MTSVLGVSPIGHEALDTPDGDAATARATLADIVRINALFGGSAAAAFGLGRLLEPAQRSHTLTLLDVGAGSGDIAQHLVRHARSRGVTLAPVALERHPVAARTCRRAGLPAVLCDAGRLPCPDRGADVVLASQILHHLERSAAITLVRELDRIARLGVIIADLRRAGAAALGIWLASYPLGFHPVTRRDAVTSVRRGFSARELATIVRAAGINAEVRARPGFRLVAAWRAGVRH